MSIKVKKPEYISDEVWTAFVKVRRLSFEFETDLEFAIALRWFIEGYYAGVKNGE